MVLELDEKSFDKEAMKGNVIIDFWAPWCGPCRVFAPIYESISKKFSGKVKFAKVNVDQNLALAAKYEIMSIPTTVFLKDGTVLDSNVGVMDEKQFVDKVKNTFKL